MIPSRRFQVLVAAAVMLGSAGCQLLFRPPELALEGLQMSGMGLSGTTLTARLIVGNPNFFDVTAERITYELTVEGKPAGKGVYDKPFTVAAGQVTRLDFPISVGWGAAMGGLGAAFGQGQINSVTTGVITVRSFIGPVDVPYKLDSRIGEGRPDAGPAR